MHEVVGDEVLELAAVELAAAVAANAPLAMKGNKRAIDLLTSARSSSSSSRRGWSRCANPASPPRTFARASRLRREAQAPLEGRAVSAKARKALAAPTRRWRC